MPQTDQRKIYYTPITYQSICRKDNWRLGGNASTFMSDDKEGRFNIEVNQYGKTKKEAKDKMIKFLSSSGQTEIVCVEAFSAT